MSQVKRASTDVLLRRLIKLAEKEGAVIYHILYRKHGVGIQWFEEKRTEISEDAYEARLLLRMRQGSVVYGYRPSLRQAISFELKRLKDHRKCRVDRAQLKRGTQAKIVHILETIAKAHSDGSPVCTLGVAEEVTRRKMPSIMDMTFRDVIKLLK